MPITHSIIQFKIKSKKEKNSSAETDLFFIFTPETNSEIRRKSMKKEIKYTSKH